MISRLLVVLIALAAQAPSFAHDGGQWSGEDPVILRWFQSLMQPDNPTMSCCGQADAYWADSFEVDAQGRTIAIITDTRDDAPLQRPHVPPGTRIVVPAHKLKWNDGNPTGHIVIFLARDLSVYCYVQNSGV